MTPNRFWQHLGVRFRELLGWEVASASGEEECAALFSDLRQLTAAHAGARSRLHALRHQVAIQEQTVAMLTERVQVHLRLGDPENAWRLALELESLRQVLASLREQVRAQRQTCQIYRGRVEQIKRQLAELRSGDDSKSSSAASYPQGRQDHCG